MVSIKRYSYVFLVLVVLVVLILPISVTQAKKSEAGSWNRKQDPVKLLDGVYQEAKEDDDAVQNTRLDKVNSNSCNELAVDSRFTVTRTLCFLKNNIHSYLQYVMYFGFAFATIFLIRNAFKLVMSNDREKQMADFKKNFIYIVIGVILLVSFYYIIDMLVTVSNLLFEL